MLGEVVRSGIKWLKRVNKKIILILSFILPNSIRDSITNPPPNCPKSKPYKIYN